LSQETAGFREREHTADWELMVWAQDLQALFQQAALGMYQLMGTHLKESPRELHSLELDAVDHESLLVTFLAELLYFGEQKGIGFDRFDLTITDFCLTGQMEGAVLESQDKEIKAVTYHNLELRKTSEGFEINIVFDV
jgi:SHS2 domain-containing protein